MTKPPELTTEQRARLAAVQGNIPIARNGKVALLSVMYKGKHASVIAFVYENPAPNGDRLIDLVPMYLEITDEVFEDIEPPHGMGVEGLAFSKRETSNSEQPDLTYRLDGSIVLLTAQSEAAIEWCSMHLPSDCPTFGKGFAIGQNYFAPILAGLVDAGLTVSAVG